MVSVGDFGPQYRGTGHQHTHNVVVNDIAASLGADVHLGVPDDKLSDCATLVYRSSLRAVANVMKRVTEGGLNGPFFRNVVFARKAMPPGPSPTRHRWVRGFGNYNLNAVRQAVLPWTNIHASARGGADVCATGI